MGATAIGWVIVAALIGAMLVVAIAAARSRPKRRANGGGFDSIETDGGSDSGDCGSDGGCGGD
ncbi:hypothetical protein [Sphingomonas sp. CFBP 13720]|uniref:hypothetical protein n=1 Tax=Sphingomonas sp. CFBP 13720 TaxID=2775302 RepID=UPI001785EE8F|nr:hypothetical protein [Sphingomonas sp. CFBP 13720]MBD8679183.1 hypothetical protein [Sphingomonas sp. CFBP 13720]